MGRIKVLLADGNASLVSATGEYLSRQGDIAVCARITDGAEIYPAVVEENPDVVVMGLILPRADGFSVLGQLAVLPETVRPRVIVLTGLTRDNPILRALNLGASYYTGQALRPPDSAGAHSGSRPGPGSRPGGARKSPRRWRPPISG